MRTRAMGERGRTLARELALPHYCLPGQHSAWDRVQNQNRADASEREGRAPAGAHSTAHTTRATRECASMHTRTWRGRARARTHLGTRAGAAPVTRAHSSGRQPRTAGGVLLSVPAAQRTRREQQHLCIRGSWRGRARAWTHLGTRAAGAGRWTALLNRRIRPLDQLTAL